MIGTAGQYASGYNSGMGRFANLEYETPKRAATLEPLGDAWPDETEGECVRRADEQYAQGNYESALGSYSRALRFDKDCDAGWSGQVRCLIRLGEYPEAALWADRGLERLRNTPDLLAGKGLARVLNGDTGDGMAFLDGAIELRSPSPWVWLARGEALLAMRQPDANAHRCFLKALELAPKNKSLEMEIGLIYNKYRRYTRAVGPLLSAAHGLTGNALAYHALGQAQEGLGEYALAMGNYERALTINARLAPARNALDALRSRNPLMRWWHGLWARRQNS